MSDMMQCRGCNAPTKMTATKLCDNCWEVHRRTGLVPTEIILLKQVLADVRCLRDRLVGSTEISPWVFGELDRILSTTKVIKAESNESAGVDIIELLKDVAQLARLTEAVVVATSNPGWWAARDLSSLSSRLAIKVRRLS